jgi:membrane-bound serine protease (ClpP class)
MTARITRFLLLVIGLAMFVESAAAAGERRVFGRSTEDSYAGKVVVIDVGQDDLMNPESFKFMRRTLRRVDAEGARAVVFNLHTPGGLAIETAELMMTEMAELKVPSFAFVNNQAMSAGALIAVATDRIYMKPVSSIGAAGLVISGPEGAEVSPVMQAKLESAFGAFTRSVVTRKGHNVDIVKAMMFKDQEFNFGDVKVPEGELLTLTGDEAVADFNGKPLLAAGLVGSVGEILQREGLAEAPVVTAEPTGFERIAWWVKVLSPLLIILGLAAAYFEIKTPGFGLGGTIAIICFAVFFFGNSVAGNLAGYELMAIFLLGVILIVLEILVLPGMVAGIIGALLVLGSLLAAMVDDFAAEDVSRGLGHGIMAAIAWPSISLAIGLAGGMTLILLMMRYLPDLPMFRAFILNTASGPMPPVDTAASPDAIGIGHSGTATTDLRPAGKAQIGVRDHSVVTRGEFIEAGTRVRVIEIGSFRTVVEKIDKEV